MTDIDILKHAQEYIQELSQGNRLSDGRASSGERYYLSAKNTNAAKRYIGIIKISDWKWQNSGIKKTDLALWFVERLFDGESFEEEILNSNAKYIKSQKRNIPKKYKTSIVLLSYLIQTGILTIDDTDELLNQCIDNGDIKKMLPDYKVMHFSC